MHRSFPERREETDLLMEEIMGKSIESELSAMCLGGGGVRGAGYICAGRKKELSFCVLLRFINLKEKTLSMSWDCAVHRSKMDEVYRKEKA